MKTRGVQLSQMTLRHLEFVEGLLESGVVTPQLALQLADQGLQGIPADARRILHPMTGEVLQLVVQHLRSGRRKISIGRDDDGQLYVAADFAA